VGANMANVTLGSDIEESFINYGITKKGILGISGSFLTSFEIGDLMYFEPELSFVQKGWALSSELIDDDSKWTFNFLELSPILRYGIDNGLSVIIGPYAGYAISGTNDFPEVDANGNTTMTTEEIDFEAAGLNQIDYGINLGISFIVNETIDFRTGYSLGFADLDDSGLNNSSVKTNGVFLKVGYLFGDY
tara:strand:+ start:81 stop:650 length:570 start_codon:yes stop_codon:yes gene_type:complete